MFKERIYKIWKQFTTLLTLLSAAHYCVQRTNIQNLKAIHNLKSKAGDMASIVFKERIYKIWKQFTTRPLEQANDQQLCSKNEYTKSESNSQHEVIDNGNLEHCVQRTNIQNLKAIHNFSNLELSFSPIVFKERIYKIWKQFTTTPSSTWRTAYCVQRTNIQNLKAIHNYQSCFQLIVSIVFKERIYKIWKQFTTDDVLLCLAADCVQRTNIQNLKAIHNSPVPPMAQHLIVFKERIYKIWKQFTTSTWIISCLSLLCSKNEYTKSESNSQPNAQTTGQILYCVQRKNIQNLKAIHNISLARRLL